MNTAKPRFLPNEPFPPYSFVPGRFPHPTSDPAGHSFGQSPGSSRSGEPPGLSRRTPWPECLPYLRGIDLFNHGYYWEAHEAWEGLWHAAGRRGPKADFLKGLIKLSAAGVKVRQGMPEGARRHAARAGELFRRAEGSLGPRYLGLSLNELAGWAEAVLLRPPEAKDETAPVEVVFGFVLCPRDEQ